MLEAILKAQISAKDREVFEGMWDAVHRYGKLTKKQASWVEDAFYKLPKPDLTKAREKTVKKATVNSTCVRQERTVRSYDQFKTLCTDASPTVLARVQKFFQVGGEVVRILPAVLGVRIVDEDRPS